MENVFTQEFLNNYKSCNDQISLAAKIERLAEESAELSAAASKYARILRGEFPSNMSENDARNDVLGEIIDVVIAVDSVNMTPYNIPLDNYTEVSDELYMQEHAHHQMNKIIKRFQSKTID